MGAGRYWRRARIKERATRDRWPPLSSASDCFHTPPRQILISNPEVIGSPSIKSSLAALPGSKSANI